jgi:elongation factor 1-beta
MGDVLSTIKVMPTGPDVDLGKVAEEIQSLEPHAIEEKPVAFGIKCLEVQFIRPDAEGGTDELEDKIRALEGVESVEVIGVTLL